MRRRRALGTLGGALLGVLAGCGAGSDEQTPATTTTRRTTRRTPTRTPTPTPTPSPTPTATPPPTPAPAPVSHGLDERFVVDEGGTPFAYTVHGLRTAERLLTTTAPEGTRFVVADCTVENLQDEETLLPTDDIWLLAEGVRRSVGVSASNAAGEDSRIERRSLASRPFTATPTRGVLAFSEAPLAPEEYRLHFTPPGTTGPTSDDPTLTHRVPVGPLDRLDRVE